jgi:hypothetical protein
MKIFSVILEFYHVLTADESNTDDVVSHPIGSWAMPSFCSVIYPCCEFQHLSRWNYQL